MTDATTELLELAKDLGWSVDLTEEYDGPKVVLEVRELDQQTARLTIELDDGGIDVTIRDGRDGRVVVRSSIDVAGSVDVGTYL